MEVLTDSPSAYASFKRKEEMIFKYMNVEPNPKKMHSLRSGLWQRRLSEHTALEIESKALVWTMPCHRTPAGHLLEHRKPH
mmetsp:Transcript_28383/g.82203  ORF Transcript_28383/g.82203 Transcript_28383/m.82203 type:complete len:81 (+) Transcript_28383:36-278(+)